MKLIKRWSSKTPKFFKILRNIGLALCAAGTTLLVSPIILPEGLVTFGGYLTVAGAVLVAVSQAVVEGEEL